VRASVVAPLVALVHPTKDDPPTQEPDDDAPRRNGEMEPFTEPTPISALSATPRLSHDHELVWYLKGVSPITHGHLLPPLKRQSTSERHKMEGRALGAPNLLYGTRQSPKVKPRQTSAKPRQSCRGLTLGNLGKPWEISDYGRPYF